MEKEKISFYIKLLIAGGFLAIISAIFVMKLIFTLSSITMPDFSGISLEKAQKVCSKLGIDLKIEDETYSNLYEKGTIISQSIKPKSKIKKGRTVYVIVSKGSKLVDVPNLIGMLKSAALVEIRNNELEEGYESTIFSNIYKENQIIAQYPLPGTKVQFKSRINYLKSLGEINQNYLMPDFSGKKIFDVYKILTLKKIYISKIEIVENDFYESGIIIGQEPLPGSKINKDSQIIFSVAKNTTDLKLKKRLIKIVYTFTESNIAKLIKIVVFSLAGSEVIFNDIVEPGRTLNFNVTVIGDAYVQIFAGKEIIKELEYKSR